MCTVVPVAFFVAAVLFVPALARLIGAAVLVAIVIAVAARAEERRADTPPQYRGAWCATKWGTIYRRCQERDRDVQFTIDRQTVTTEETTCTLSAVRRRGGEHRVWLERRDDNQGDHSEQERWRLGTNRTMSRDPFKNQNCPE
jgi:hypothetical protein